MTPANSPATQSNDNFIPVNTQTWANGRHTVRCVKVIHETHDIRTFSFMAEQPVMFFFKPGQFVTLELEINNEQIMRSYTISSAPSVPYSFSITIKREPHGQVSNWLHDNMEVGSELAVHGPVGRFNCIDFPASKALILAGGVGITPMMSMTRWWFDTNADVDMLLIQSARTPADLVFYRELEHMSSRIDNLAVHAICERIENGQVWFGYRGFLDESKLKMIAPDFLEREVFCCGPQPYMDAVKKILRDNGYDMRRYHEESFDATPKKIKEEAVEQAEEAVELAEAIDTSDLHTISFDSHGKSIQALPGETIHAAASRLDIQIPKACGVGICGTCKVKVVDGNVQMDDNGGITEDDAQEGYVLSCCTVPKGDLNVEA